MAVLSRPKTERAGAFALCFASLASVVNGAVCDIYSSGGTPCVAAHSTTRSLYDGNTGALYQVQRASDNATQDINAVSTGGIADSASQDSFCAGTTCVISTIYDQSGHNNHLTAAPPGGAAKGPGPNGYDNLADATAAPVYLNGQKVYGVYIAPGMGYRNNAASGTATGDEPEGIYALLDGTHYDTGCCFDYGNAETSSDDTGDGHMEAIYFGTGDGWSGTGTGSGPWIMADLENYLYSGVNQGSNNDPTIDWEFVVAVVKGEPNQWAIRGGDGTSGSMSTFYSGPRPNGWNPMHKEGAIILGTGGDNSDSGDGTFYEGVMTTGYPSDDTEDQVQADVIAQKYSSS